MDYLAGNVQLVIAIFEKNIIIIIVTFLKIDIYDII